MEKNNQKNDYQSYFDNNDLNENRYYGDNSEANSSDSNSENGFNIKKMDKDRKIALIILGIFSVAVITIWFVNFKYSLRSPFNYQGDTPLNNNNSGSCVDGNCAESGLDSSNLDLKLIDTDGDGISDWDELFIYGTSPYLEDTDGDGLTDYEEIFIYKTNPLCPEGQDCSGVLNQSSSQNSNISSENTDDFYNFLSGLEDSGAGLTGNIGSDKLPDNLQPNQVDINYLRSTLIENGFNKSDLDQISDSDLMAIYQDVLTDF